MPRALITGGTGFAGRHLAARLQGLGYDVVGTTFDDEHVAAPFETAPLDVRDAEAAERLISRVRPDEVYHLAGLSRPTGHTVRDYYDVHLNGTLNVLQAVRATGLGDTTRVLAVGSAYAYGAWDSVITETTPLEPINHYGASKAAGDLASRAAAIEGLFVIRARPFNHVGPGQASSFVVPSIVEQVQRIRNGTQAPILRLGRTDPTRDFLDVRDVVEAYRLLLEHGRSGEAYNVASGIGTTIGELVDRIGKVSGTAFEVQVEDARVRGNDLVSLVGDPTKLRSVTGWRPQWSLEDTLADMLQIDGS